MTEDSWQAWFEAAWAEREEEVYPRLFGSHDPQICVLTPHLFQTTFEQENVDPRWLHSGVFEVPPTPDRASWLYVSSGLSNAWEDDTPDPTGPSGLGMEFILQTPSREFWAIDRLAHVIAFQILLSVGEYPGRELLDVHARLPLRCSISPEPSELTWLVVGPPDGLPSSFQLASGVVDLLTIVGVTEQEVAHARERAAIAFSRFSETEALSRSPTGNDSRSWWPRNHALKLTRHG